MLYAAIDIHKRMFQAAVLDVETGETEELSDWAMPLQGKLAAVAIEATNGWRWVWRELSARGFDVRLVDPAQAKTLRGRIKPAKTDRLDARWLCVLLAKEMLPESWLPLAEIQALRDQTRLRKALAEDRTRWAQRLHALLAHEGWPCQRARLLAVEGRRWVNALSPALRSQVERPDPAGLPSKPVMSSGYRHYENTQHRSSTTTSTTAWRTCSHPAIRTTPPRRRELLEAVQRFAK
jgi:transposase